MFKRYIGPFFAPDDDKSGGGTVQPFGESGDVAILEEGLDETDAEESDDSGEDKASDKDNKRDKEDPDEIDETDEEELEKDDKEEKDDEEDDEKETKESTSGRPALKAITAKYPNLFKDFPQLKDSYFRVEAYSELFPTVDDAREAQEKSDTLDNLENVIVKQGSSLELFNSIKETNPVALGKFVENLLPTLYEFDTKLFYRATEPVTRQLLWSAKQHGLKTKDENLVASTQHISNFLFGDSEVEKPDIGNKKKADDPDRIQLEKDKAEFANTKRGEFMTELNARAGRELIKSISDGLDPKSVMSDFLKQTITEKILDEVGSRLEKDERHMSRMRSLHARAEKAGFPKAMTDQITSAYLSAAKLLVPIVRTEIKQKAMGGKRNSNGNGNGNGNRKQIPTSGSPGAKGQNLSKISPKQVDWGKTSDMDFLMDKVTLKH